MIECPHEKIAVGAGARLREGHRQADGGASCTTSSACCRARWASTTPTSTAPRCSSSAAPARPTTTGAGPTSTGSTRPTCRARRCGPTPSGTTSRARSRPCRPCSARAYRIADGGAARPGLRRPGRRPAGGRRSTSRCPWTTSPRLAAVAVARWRRSPTALRAAGRASSCAARRPVIVPSATPGATRSRSTPWWSWPRLVGIGVVETHWRLNFPNRHPLNVTGTDRARGRRLRAVRRRQGHGQADPEAGLD